MIRARDNRTACQPGDLALDWNAQGPAGPAGPQGPAGANGTSVVNSALPVGDANCPYGGTAFTGAGGTTFAGGTGTITLDGSGITVNSGLNLRLEAAADATPTSGAETRVKGSLTLLDGGSLLGNGVPVATGDVVKYGDVVQLPGMPVIGSTCGCVVAGAAPITH